MRFSVCILIFLFHIFEIYIALDREKKNGLPKVISPVSGSLVTAAVRPTPDEPRPVVY